MTPTHQAQAQRAALPRGSGLVPSRLLNVVKLGRVVAGIGRRSAAPLPMIHDEKANPSPVHRPAQEVDVAEINAIRSGLYVRQPDGHLARDDNGDFIPRPKPVRALLDRAPPHALDVAATLSNPESTRIV